MSDRADVCEQATLEPGENLTRDLMKPLFMIENIRTSKYDRCSDMFPPWGSAYSGLRQGSTVKCQEQARTLID